MKELKLTREEMHNLLRALDQSTEFCETFKARTSSDSQKDEKNNELRENNELKNKLSDLLLS